MSKIPYNELFEEESITNIRYSISLSGKEIYLSLEELKEYKEDWKKIRCFQKIYRFGNGFEKWIVLFSNDTPQIIDGKRVYYKMTHEKSIKNYGFNILDNIDIDLIQKMENQ